ncbi:MAG TPA: hypothetical protein VJ777_28420 [Mycobacterium sp.]|nr:hypothetical protein [Mycobacterium sp.]
MILNGAGGVRILRKKEIAGSWENVTPGAMDLTGQGGAAYGCNVVLAHPTTAGLLYAYNDRDGVWTSTQAGKLGTWTKVSPEDDPGLDAGKLWGGEILSDGTLLACCGDNFADPPGAATEYRVSVGRSTDGGASWTWVATAASPYGLSKDPTDSNHLLGTDKGGEKIIESSNGGQGWSDRGDVTGLGNSAYPLLLNATTAILISQDEGGIWRGTKSGSTWTWTNIDPDIVHYHGVSFPFYDVAAGLIFMPHKAGIVVSDDLGLSWDDVSASAADCIWATATRMYAATSAPTQDTYTPNIRTATRAALPSFGSPTNPSGMDNGPRTVAVTTSPTTGQTVVVTSNWLAGLWRWVEPS